MTLRIKVTSLFVDDQDQALSFYTETLGFVKKRHVPMGEVSWITVVSPHELDGIELLLEPADHPAVGPFRQAFFDEGIPFASFTVSDVTAECKRLLQAQTASGSLSTDTMARAQACAAASRASTTPRSPSSRCTVSDVTAECKRLLQAGVRFVEPPTVDAGITTAVFDDTCGNLIEISSS